MAMSITEFGLATRLVETDSDASETEAHVSDPEWELPLEHLSPSSLIMLQACPRQFQQRYIQKRRERPGQSQALGYALHSALAFNFRCKVHTEHDLSVSTLSDYWGDMAWPNMIDHYGGASEVQWDANPLDVRDLGRQMIVSYLPTAERVVPDLVEVEVKTEVPGVPVPVLGYVDLIQADNKPIIDWKTSKQAQRQLKPEWRLQGRIYSLCTGRPVDWHVITKGKTPTVYTSLEAPDLFQFHSDEIASSTERLIRALAHLAQHYYAFYGPDEDWPQLGIGHLWRCGKYCAYTGDCPAWAGGFK